MKRATGILTLEGDDKTLIGLADGRQMLAEALHSHIVKRWSRTLGEAQANAARLVECWNGCEAGGITNPAALPALMKAVPDVWQALLATGNEAFLAGVLQESFAATIKKEAR